MANPATVDTDIRQLLSEQLGVDLDDIKDSSNLVADLDADSLDVVELIIAIEEMYKIEVPDDDAEKLVTVADLVEYVQRRIA